MCPASLVMPKPTTSPTIGWLRRSALSNDSSTNTAAPSASTNPLRSALKGRQAPSGCSLSTAITRIDSHERIAPNVNGASLPPASPASISPARMARKACPIADPLGVEVSARELRLLDRLLGGDEREAREAVVPLDEPLVRLARHFAADPAVQRRGVDRFDEADAAAAGAESVDRGALAAAEGG